MLSIVVTTLLTALFINIIVKAELGITNIDYERAGIRIDPQLVLVTMQ